MSSAAADDAATFLIDFEAQAADVIDHHSAAAGEEYAKRGIVREAHAVIGQRQQDLERGDQIEHATGDHRADLAETEAE